jgi:DNA-binding transcriptional MocR family regulator
VAEQYQVIGDSASAISASIEAGVLRGDWAAGETLPPIRLLAQSLEVSPATVAKAYQHLRQRGIVETAGRHGTRVRSRPAVAGPRSALRLAAPPGALDLSSGDPDVRLLPALGRHVHAIAEELDAPLGYGAADAMPELVAAAGLRLAADGVPVEDAVIAVTNGTLDGLERLFATHLRPGDAVAVEDPGWANLLDLVAALGLTPVPVRVDAEGPLPDSLSAAIAAGARAAVLTARAQNPTGAAIGEARAEALRTVLSLHPDVLLVEDDHAAELSAVPLHSLGGVTAAWAFLRSASKPFGPDLRIALMAGDEATMGRVLGRLRIGTGWVSTVTQRLLLRLWHDDDVATAVEAAGASYDRRRRALIGALSTRGVRVHATTGINLWVEVPDETHAVVSLRDAGYTVAPGVMFRVGSPPGIRITISPLDEGAVEPLADAVATAVRPAGLAGLGR